ncbi:caspase family protein [Rhizobium laguerreae]|uniref:caspase family protein n=1 Tax=Rhizobium laguerreae TaxID=1076926 RepID=UPI0021B0A407|nr:caspase domain-containing protein [Rhizobium laguerreae]
MQYLRIALTIFLMLMCSQAFAEKRVALVVGNSAYQHVPTLPNPKNDAGDMAAKLRDLGFVVVVGNDLDLAGVRRTISDFVDKLDGADMALFYYAGHGLQVNGENYIAPVDAKLLSYIDLEFEAVPMNLILSAMERTTRVNLVFLDACRDNPLAVNLARSMGTRSASVGRGLARVGSGIGSLIAFATQPGNIALDGVGRNSPFTAALLRHLGKPGRDITRELIDVRLDVLRETNGRQVSWDNSSLTGEVVLRSPEKLEPATAAETGITDNAAELTFWDTIKDVDGPGRVRCLSAPVSEWRLRLAGEGENPDHRKDCNGNGCRQGRGHSKRDCTATGTG